MDLERLRQDQIGDLRGQIEALASGRPLTLEVIEALFSDASIIQILHSLFKADASTLSIINWLQHLKANLG